MKGQLSGHPLAELIREISAAGLSGALRLTLERVKAVVYFEDGEIVYATSNLRIHRLSECVRRWGVITEQQLASVPERATDIEFGSGLVAAGILSHEALEELLARQVSDVLRPALLWIEGLWDFDIRARAAEDVRVKVDVNELLVMCARRLPAEFIASRFMSPDEKLSPASNDFASLNLLPTEGFVLSRVDMPISIHELTAIGGLPEEDTLRATYALTLGGFLKRDTWPCAFTPEEVAKALAVKTPSAKTVPTTVAVRSQVKKEIAVQMPTASLKEEPDKRSELNELFERLSEATNYYQILGVTRSTAPNEIKRTYHSLARRFHPDRFRQEVDTTLYARIESAFAQIAQAYETLKDTQLRDAYDITLNAQKKKTR